MSDYKAAYHEESYYYIHETVPASPVDQNRYARSKGREATYNDSWLQNPVNLNDICDEFAPGDSGRRQGYKYIFEGSRYLVKADMVAGYLRIYDKILRCFIRLDKSPGSLAETHFKIIKREEM